MFEPKILAGQALHHMFKVRDGVPTDQAIAIEHANSHAADHGKTVPVIKHPIQRPDVGIRPGKAVTGFDELLGHRQIHAQRVANISNHVDPLNVERDELRNLDDFFRIQR